MGAGSMKPRVFSTSLDSVITALCADYDRRESAINEGSVSPRIAMEYKYINYNIFTASAEIVGEKYALMYIREIGNKQGFASSEHDAVCESTYKIEKRDVKINIAKRLHLAD